MSSTVSNSALLAKRPRLRDDLLISRELRRGPDTVHLIRNQATGRAFEISVKEHFLLRRLDGNRTLGEIGDQYAVRFGRRIVEDHWIRLLWLLRERDLLDPATTTAAPGTPGGSVAPWIRWLGLAFRRTPVMLVLCGIAAVAAGAVAVRAEPLWTAARPVVGQPLAWLALVLLAWMSAVLHELAHAAAAVRLGATVKKINLLTLTCHIDDYPYLAQRREPVVIAAAGTIANGVVLAVVWAAVLAAGPGHPAYPALCAYLLIGGVQTVVNLVPLPPLDGYKIACQALNMLDLATESRRFVRRTLTRPFRPSAVVYPKSTAAWLSLYATWWLLALAAGTTVAVYSAGLWLRPSLGRSAYLLAAAVAVLTVAGWLARPTREPRTRDQQPQEGMRMTSTDGPAIVLDAVKKSYGAVRAVDDVSLTIRRGEFFGLLGPNGAGKTTLIEMIEGLRVPDAGTVSVLGMSPAPRNLKLLPLIGVQTQSAAFFTRLTAREHLVTVAALYGLPASAADRALELVGLTGSAGIRVTNISGGQRQRLAIASALVHDPQVIFLDEPTAALDPQARRDLGQMLRELKAIGKTVVYTTHHLDEAQGLCDRVAILSDGRILALDTPRELIARSGVGTRLFVPASRLPLEEAGRLDGVDSAAIEDGAIVLRTGHVARVLAALGASGDLDDVETRPATLEDVYLELMGATRE